MVQKIERGEFVMISPTSWRLLDIRSRKCFVRKDYINSNFYEAAYDAMVATDDKKGSLIYARAFDVDGEGVECNLTHCWYDPGLRRRLTEQCQPINLAADDQPFIGSDEQLVANFLSLGRCYERRLPHSQQRDLIRIGGAKSFFVVPKVPEAALTENDEKAWQLGDLLWVNSRDMRNLADFDTLNSWKETEDVRYDYFAVAMKVTLRYDDGRPDYSVAFFEDEYPREDWADKVEPDHWFLDAFRGGTPQLTTEMIVGADEIVLEADYGQAVPCKERLICRCETMELRWEIQTKGQLDWTPWEKVCIKLNQEAV